LIIVGSNGSGTIPLDVADDAGPTPLRFLFNALQRQDLRAAPL
jgi:hypothetical protein